MTKAFGALPLVAALVTGCANDNGGTTVDRRVDLPPEPEHGVQFVLPEAVVQPGEEKLYCWYITMPEDEDVWVREYQAFQGEGGHHVVAFVTYESEPDGTVIDCAEPSSMALWLPLLTPTSDNHLELPDGFGVKIPGGAKLVFQSHYVNAGEAPIRVADVVNVHYVPDDEIAGITPAASWGNTVLDFSIAPGETKTVSYECPVEQEMNLITLYGHMHEFGKSISIQLGPAGGPLETVYEIMEWSPSYRDEAPLREWTVDAPYTLVAGDVIRVSCTWTNGSENELTFPAEMCASLAWFFPSEDPVTCAGSPL